MMDVVIPLGKESKWQDNELRYSLRSFEGYMKGIGTIFIVGDLPGWITGVTHIPYPDLYKIPAINTTYKIIEACKDERVSTNFLLSNDDFFLLKQFHADLFPYYYRWDLLHNIQVLGNTVYARSRKFTHEALSLGGFGTRSFELHCPMRINKNEFLKMSNIFVWQNGLLPRSIYGNMMNLKAEMKGDYIIKLPLNLSSPIEKNSFFSIREGEVNAEMQSLFEILYPVKSKWEI